MLAEVETWPANIRWVREAFLADWEKLTGNDKRSSLTRMQYPEYALRSSPRFFVASEGKVLVTATQVGGWQWYVQPVLDQLVGK